MPTIVHSSSLVPVSLSLVALAAIYVLTSPPHATIPLPSPSFSVAPASSPASTTLLTTMQHGFVENQGQWDPRALFFAKSPGVNTWITDTGVVYDFQRFEPNPGSAAGLPGRPVEGIAKHHVLRMEFVGGGASQVVGSIPLEGAFNYYIGNDKSRWTTNVRRFGEARSEQVYPGIEARWYFDQGRPRYDLMVAPGADPGKIAMRFEGANSLAVEKNVLKLGTSLGVVEHRGLFAYQKIDGGTKQVNCSLVLDGKNVRFQAGNYDRSRPLVIDPLIWSTLIGGAGNDNVNGIAINGGDFTAVCGLTSSNDFPTSAGAYDMAASGTDAFVARFTPGGLLEFATVFGGSGNETASGVDFDSANNLLVCAMTDSADCPTTLGAFDTTLNGANDVVVFRLSSDGGTLQYSTLIGGSGIDTPQEIKADSADRAIVVGETASSNFPTTAGAYDLTPGSFSNVFVTRVDSSGTTLGYSTYIGGSFEAGANGLALDSADNPVLTGYTGSSDFPTTAGAYQTAKGGTGYEAFVTKLFNDGSSLIFSTYIGGTSADQANAVALDASENPVIVGRTLSTNFPKCVGTNAGGYDAFVARLTADGSGLMAARYVGGAFEETAPALALDSLGNVVVGLVTGSSDMPVAGSPFDGTFNGVYDGFIAKFNSSLTTLRYGSFFGGPTQFDAIYAVAVDSGDEAVVGGLTYDPAFPTTPGAFDETHNGIGDAFLAKFRITPTLAALQTPSPKLIGGFSLPLTVKLNQPALSGGADVAISTDTPSKLYVPASAKVKENQSSRKIGVRTETVLADTLVHITGTFNGITKTIPLTLKPGGLKSLKLNGASMLQMTLNYGTVTLSANAPPGGRYVGVHSGNAAVLFVQPSVEIPEGQSTAILPIYAGPVASPTLITVKATLGTMTKTDTITVNP